jgi:hypothetical protein
MVIPDCSAFLLYTFNVDRWIDVNLFAKNFR